MKADAASAARLTADCAANCPLEWCTLDHSKPHDDFDGHGSRFHWSDRISFIPASEPTYTFNREPLSLKWLMFADVEHADGPWHVRADVNDGPVLTADEVRQYARWLLAQADDMDGATAALPFVTNL